MAHLLGENHYGKSRVRVMKVTHDAVQHRVDEWNVEVWLGGDFRACFADGDNSEVLPTDTMKNTVYSLARASKASSIEGFAIELVSHFIENNPYCTLAGAQIESTAWGNIISGTNQFPTAFTHADDKHATTTVSRTRAGMLSVISGFDNFWLLKTAHSAFSGFLKDTLTTLKESSDRLLGTLAKADWRYTPATSGLADSDFANFDFNALRKKTEAALLRTFATHNSLSVQQTLFAMAGATLDAVNEVAEVTLSMPNKHCNLVDLSPFGQDNPNMIFVPTDEPHGAITACVRRDA